MNSKVATAMFAVVALALFALSSAAPAVAATTVCGGEITPPMLSDVVPLSSVTVQSWSFSWAGVTPNTMITLTAVSSNSAWTVTVTSPVSSGASGSGSTTLTVTITAPSSTSSTQITVTSSTGACAISSFASASEGITGGSFPPPVPEFSVPAIAVAGLGMIMLAVLRSRSPKSRLHSSR